MGKDYFEKEKNDYANIEIPEELDFVVRKSLKEGKRKYKNKGLSLVGKVVAASFTVFFVTLNVFPKVSIAAQNIPIIGGLARILTFDKGFTNAVEDGFVQQIGYEKEVNGIKLKVNNITGDSKTIWIEYEVRNHGDYNVHPMLMKKDLSDGIEAGVSLETELFGEDKNYIQCNFNKFTGEFIIQFSIEPKNALGKKTTIDVPIKLDEKFNEGMKEISVNNKIISTEIGDIEIKALKSSKTRVSLEFALNSEEYEFMGFDNPVLIDSNGIEHGLSSLYFSGDEGGNNRNIDFQGEIKDGNVTLKYDGIYYARRDNRKINIDLLNKKIEDNDYGIELESIEGDIINLKAKDTNDFSFKVEGGVFHKISGSVRQVEGKSIESGVKLGIVDKERETLELYLDYILRDKTKGIEFKLN